MISPEKRDGLKAALVQAIERADPSRVGRADTTAEGMILVAELIPKVAEALAKTRGETGAIAPPIETALRILVEHTAGNRPLPDLGPRSEELLSVALDEITRGPRADPKGGPGVIMSFDESQAMRLINEAITRSRKVDPGRAPETRREGPETL
jgi:hypothetical protein